MALLLMDGFDHLGTGVSPVTVGNKWAVSHGAGVVTSTSPVRTGTHALKLPFGSATLSKAFTPSSNGGIAGFAFYWTATLTVDDIFEFREVSTIHMALGVNSSQLLVVKRGSTTLATGTTIILPNTWYYIEFKAIIHDTTGSYEVRIDGITEAALTNAGPTDTRNAGTTGQWDRFGIDGITATASTSFDDFYLCDTSGSAPYNTFLGPVKIETLYPQTDAVAVGSNAGLTTSTGTDHGALVDETAPNTTDYNGSATVGVKDTYQYPNMTLSGTILAIQTNLYCLKTDTSARTVCPVIRTNSVDYDGTPISPNTTFTYSTEVKSLNPNTGVAWTVADINAIQVGMKVIT